jgi:dolichol-phosphate mannosyltransferase
LGETNKIVILLPVLNEIENIGPLLDRIRDALTGRDYVVCVVDDGSRDGTAEFVRAEVSRGDPHLHLIERKKSGRGSQRGGALLAALKWGLQDNATAIFVEMDGDLSHRPEELATGLSKIESGRAEIAIASKYLPGSKVTNRPVGRLIVSRICNWLVRAVISSRITDYSNGYRFYTRHAAELVAASKIKYGSPIYLTEVMAIWIAHDLTIAEFPTHYVGRNEGLSKLRFIDLVKASVGILEVATRLHLNKLEIAGSMPAEPATAKWPA